MFAAAPLELILVEAMPDVCSEHGEPAAESRPFTVSSSGPGSEIPSVGSVLRSLSTSRKYRTGGVRALVRFACPACVYCLHDVRRYRRIALLLLLVIAITIGATIVARYFAAQQFYLPLAFAILPGCFPILLFLAVVLWKRSSYFADVWMADPANQLIVFAHPNFVAAVQERRAESH
ncbi:hypothetical protein [Nocardia sp. NPDC060255]|uniref:hypothetical protein n=1 Tax=Nocardia sp. NPDC060255 TaxID=3347085 RepID=UPI00364DA45D